MENDVLSWLLSGECIKIIHFQLDIVIRAYIAAAQARKRDSRTKRSEKL
jgi:hypothetical protein